MAGLPGTTIDFGAERRVQSVVRQVVADLVDGLFKAYLAENHK